MRVAFLVFVLDNDGMSTMTETNAEQLLTTGQAAQLLGSSRQHVVDLCESGDLPYLTVGTHRRLRREDVEQARQRTTRSNRSDRRSRWLNIAVAGELVRDPETVLRRAHENLELLQAKHPRGQGASWLRQWEKLLDGPVEDVLDVLTSQTPRARELRTNSPFAGVLSSEDREKVLHAFQTRVQRRVS
jgi:excisionase family DNA binding protein